MSCKIHINKRIIPADLETPVSLYLKIRDLHPSSALLESSDYHTSSNAMSYIGVEPTGAFTVHHAPRRINRDCRRDGLRGSDTGLQCLSPQL